MTQFDPHAHDGGVPAAFHFTVSFGDAPGVADCQFVEVGGLAPYMALEDVQEGGENRWVHALPKGIKHPLLVLKRGLVPLSAAPASTSWRLRRWCCNTNPSVARFERLSHAAVRGAMRPRPTSHGLRLQPLP